VHAICERTYQESSFIPDPINQSALVGSLVPFPLSRDNFSSLVAGRKETVSVLCVSLPFFFPFTSLEKTLNNTKEKSTENVNIHKPCC